jgi:hypothetical protein
MQSPGIHDVLSQRGASARHERNKPVRELISTKGLVIEEANRHVRIHMGLEKRVQLSDVPTDAPMGVRFKARIEGAQIETYRYHAP